jgi:hypothetical protein
MKAITEALGKKSNILPIINTIRLMESLSNTACLVFDNIAVTVPLDSKNPL